VARTAPDRCGEVWHSRRGMDWTGMAQMGMVWQAGRGMAWKRQDWIGRHGSARHSVVGQGRHGQACSGQVGHGGDRYGRRGTEG